LATLLFAADKEVSKWTVFAGASLALIVALGIGVLAGAVLSQYVSEKTLRYVAGIGFVGIGVWSRRDRRNASFRRGIAQCDLPRLPPTPRFRGPCTRRNI
jgi:uncharacterized membrane protein YfcA